MASFGYQVAGFGAGGGILGQVDAVNYNGTNSYFSVEGGTTDLSDNFDVDNTMISFVTWLKPTSSLTGTENFTIFGLFDGTGNADGIKLAIFTGGGYGAALQFSYGDRGSEDHRLIKAIPLPTTRFTCVMINLPVGFTSDAEMWYNNGASLIDANPTLNPTSTQGSLYTPKEPFIGKDPEDGRHWPGCIGPIWMTDEHIDFSVAANREKFTDSTGQGFIKDLGADGSIPTGTQPKIYFKGNASNITQHGSLSLGTGTLTRNNLTNCNNGIVITE